MEEKIYYCYKATNKVNQKIYIGFASNPKTRWRNHKKDADKGKGYVFHSAIRKYGWDTFEFEVICCGKNKREMLEHVEPALIKQYNSAVPNGYNIRRTAMIGPCFIIPGQPNLTAIKPGQHFSPSTEFKPGQHFSPSTEFKKGHSPLAAFTGHHHTKEAKDRIKKKLQILLSDPVKKEKHRIAALGNRSRAGQKQSIEERNKHRLSDATIKSAQKFRDDGLTHQQIATNLNKEGLLNKHGKEWNTKAVSSLFERIRREKLYPNITYAEWRNIKHQSSFAFDKYQITA